MDYDLVALVDGGGDDAERNAPIPGGGDGGELVQGEHHLRTGLHTQKTQPEIAAELNGSFNDMRDAMKGLTPDFVASSTKADLHTKKLELETLVTAYKREFPELKLDNLMPENKVQWENQNTSMIQWEVQMKTFFKGAEEAKEVDPFNLGTTYAFEVGSDGAKLVEDFKRERREHAAEIKKLRDDINALKSASQTQIDDLKTATQTIDQLKTTSQSQLDDLKATNETRISQLTKSKQEECDRVMEKSIREKQFAERQILLMQQQLLQRQPTELSYDEVDIEEAEEQAAVGGTNELPQEQGSVNLKLDTFHLPSFNGDLENWETFKDMFEYLVNKSKKMTKVMKFHQLRSVLTGPALDCIRGYQVTAKNYDAAWIDLNKRFDRTTEISDEYMRKFLEVPALKSKATHITIRAIIDATNQMLRALPGLNITINNWDPFLNLIIRTKLNGDIRSEWNRLQAKDKSSKITDLLDFLEGKANEALPIQIESLNQLMSCEPKKKSSHRIFQVNEQPAKPESKAPKCGICNGTNHKTTSCFKLTKSDAKSRYALVKKQNLCFKCLQPHKVENCKKDNCNHCSKPHHPMLCFKREAEKENISPIRNSNEEWNRPSCSKNPQ